MLFDYAIKFSMFCPIAVTIIFVLNASEKLFTVERHYPDRNICFKKLYFSRKVAYLKFHGELIPDRTCRFLFQRHNNIVYIIVDYRYRILIFFTLNRNSILNSDTHSDSFDDVIITKVP